MLILTRKLNEDIYIGDDVRIVVTRLEHGRVSLGIDAPKDVLILRGELLPPSQSASEVNTPVE